MTFSPLIDQLIQALQALPGVGPKSAQRMALHLLQRKPSAAVSLAQALSEAVDKVGHCQACRTLCEEDLCRICGSTKRNEELLCVVEQPADVLAIEQTGGFQGFYFVLMGHLSPIDGIGPSDLGIDVLLERVKTSVTEVILATNSTVEGETTAHYIAQQLQNFNHLCVSRIAHGVPMGGELEFVNGGTLAHALAGRTPLMRDKQLS